MLIAPLLVYAFMGCAIAQSDSSPIAADPRVVTAIDFAKTWLDAQRDYDRIPGISVGVVHDQDIVWSHGFGSADVESETPATPQTIYSICSISKLFTSIAVMQLRDAGKLELDDPVKRHLEWFDIQQTYPQSSDVTIRGILTHSAGLPRESDFPYWTGPDFKFPSQEQIVERLPDQHTLYRPYTYFQYSNLGLTLAGEIVAKVSGEPYVDYMREHVLAPLELSDTKPTLPGADDPRFALGYSALTRKGNREPMPRFDTNGVASAAGFSSTVEDMARFASWQFRALAGEDDRVLDGNTLKEMQRVQYLDPDWKTARGLGFEVKQSGKHTLIGHGGSCPGFRTHIWLEPKDQIAVVFMANASGIAAHDYAERLFEIFAGPIGDAAESPEAAEPSESSLDKYVGTYNTQPWRSEMAVVLWKDQLHTMDLPTMKPLDGLQPLERVEGDTFKRIRDNGEPAESVVFVTDETGVVTHIVQNSNRWPKVR